MANPLKGEASVTLEDGRTLTLAFDVNAWIEVEEETGLKMPEIIKALSDKDNPPSLKLQRAIIWGGLRKHHPEMTVREAGEVLVEAAGAMEKAVTGGMPEAEGGSADSADENPPKKRSGRGTASATVGAVSA